MKKPEMYVSRLKELVKELIDFHREFSRATREAEEAEKARAEELSPSAKQWGWTITGYEKKERGKDLTISRSWQGKWLWIWTARWGAGKVRYGNLTYPTAEGAMRAATDYVRIIAVSKKRKRRKTRDA